MPLLLFKKYFTLGYLSIVKRSWAVLSKIDSSLPTLMGYLEQTALFITIFIIFYKSLTNLSTQLRLIILNLLHVDSYLLRVHRNANQIDQATSKVVRKFFTFVSVLEKRPVGKDLHTKVSLTSWTVMGYLEQTALFITIFIIFYKSLTNLSTQLRLIILNLLHVDSYLLRVHRNADQIDQATSKVVRKFFTFVSVYLVSNCLFFIYKAKASPQKYWITVVVYMQYFLVFIIVLEYYTVLKLIQSRLVLLNEAIEKLLYYRTVNMDATQQFYYTVLKLIQSRLVLLNEAIEKLLYYRTVNNMDATQQFHMDHRSHVSQLIEIKGQMEVLHQVYFDMVDNCTNMNQNFALLLLFIITTTFLGTTTLVFVMSNIILASLKGSEIGAIIFYLSYWLGIRCFVLIVIVTSSVDTSSEASKARRLAHRLLIEDNLPEILDDVTLFANRLHSRKVQFTACGFFPLDFTLLYNIIGATTTYWIILIQFQLQTT
ncbi:putative gustatory receptor 28a [Diaphorina citri]|uniref:Gustatory receptor n=1 Tax=Diaphorina citri TaxID=121845 RepID=A0A1S4EA18_DIACI|nr:putative gustatory receptor 28a [Diaphorina citri]